MIGIGVLSIYVGVVSMYLWLLIMMVRLFFLNRVELGIFSLMFGSSLYGRLFASDQLVVVLTTCFLILGYVLLRKEILRVIMRNRVSWLVFAALLFYFVVMYLLGPMNSYATGKIARLVIRGITWMMMFQVFAQSKNVNNIQFAILLGLLAVFYMSQAYELYGVRPHGLFDVNYFREIVTDEVGLNDDNSSIVNTHTLGYLAIGCLLFFISDQNFTLTSVWNWCIVSIALLIVIISGARHTMVVFAFLFSFRFVLNNGGTIKNVLIACFCLFVLGVVIFNSGIGSIEETKSANTLGQALNRDIETPFRVMRVEPVFGVGFGGYLEHGIRYYPHNIIFEIFSEFGIIGSFIIILFIVVIIVIGKFFIFYRTANGTYLILFFMMYAFKSLITGDLSANIVVFSLMLSFVNTCEIGDRNAGKWKEISE